MIVGTKTINMEELSKHTKSHEALEDYALRLVPKYLRHHEAITMNQKYLVALHLRKIESIPYKKRKELCETLLSGIHITGVPTQLYDMSDIVCLIDMDKLMRFLEENGQ